MEIELLKKFFENKCSSEESKKVIEWLEHSPTENDLESDFKYQWQKIKVKSGNYEKWSEQLEKVHEKIAMEDLYDSLNIEEKGEGQKDRKGIAKREIFQYPENKNRKRVIPVVITTLILAIVAIGYIKFPNDYQIEPVVTQLTKSTEKGQKLTIHLNDGSKVILNSGSKLYYPSIFTSADRTIRLEGEAFFEVSEDTLRPFRVITESVITTALGTSFNVNAFPDEKNIEIALVSGKVSVQKIDGPRNGGILILDPGEMATVKKEEPTILKSMFSFYQNISWKDGVLFFKNATYSEVINKLENWYGVSLSTDGYPEREWNFSGKFEDEALDNVLEALQFGHDFTYSINRNEVKLKF